MKTTVKAYHLPTCIDLKEIAGLVTDYAKEVEKLEEQLGEKDRRIHELEAVVISLGGTIV
jgi:hypothetical protein